MSDLERRPGSRPSRRSREQRAYQMVMVGGVAAVVAVVTFILAVAGVIGFGIPVLAIVVAAVCGFLFRRTVAP